MAGLERGELRQALLAEVKKVCAGQGPEAVSISKIGKSLGVSSGAPFRLFPSREHIFAALIESEMERLDATFERIWSCKTTDPVLRLTDICQAYVDHARTEPAMFRLAFSVSAKAMGAVKLQKIGEDVYEKVQRAVAACVPRHTTTDQVELKSYLLWSTIHGHVMLCMTGQMDDQSIDLPDEIVVASAVQGILKAG
ncbi:TetR/AcrR family transcriptional regulator [Jannaschia sp. CCS1]|uniref:TetR/AcrR family transcriptional regulator n=1 Tax=Jannaschia sp. (strain CCS1) TaxID=290400 RepID=UPI000053A5AD|nr:TetR/AcrR family transcriptional regulator [Jannaschia sp. CCS1]ABD55341.1 transcriptional regulator, TetR family [Jannaschia sp. CCS1]